MLNIVLKESTCIDIGTSYAEEVRSRMYNTQSGKEIFKLLSGIAIKQTGVVSLIKHSAPINTFEDFVFIEWEYMTDGLFNAFMNTTMVNAGIFRDKYIIIDYDTPHYIFKEGL